MTEEEQDKLYMTHPDSKSVKGFIRALEIFSPHFDKGLQETYFMGGEHDILFMYVDLDQIPPDTVHGKELISLGWHTEKDTNGWAYHT